MNKFKKSRGCAKCGNLHTIDKYIEKTERIRRECISCDFIWSEATLDS